MISDEELLCYYYEDGLSEEERRRVDAALAGDRVLEARYSALVKDLEHLSTGPLATATEVDKQRWHEAIEQAADDAASTGWASRSARAWMWGGALAASVLLGVGIGSRWDVPLGPNPGASAPLMAALDGDVLRRGLLVHVERAEVEMASLADLPVSQQSELIAQLVSQNRLFIRAAVDSDSPELARHLRAMELTLKQLMETQQSLLDANQLRQQLQFEMRMMLTRLERAPSNKA